MMDLYKYKIDHRSLTSINQVKNYGSKYMAIKDYAVKGNILI